MKVAPGLFCVAFVFLGNHCCAQKQETNSEAASVDHERIAFGAAVNSYLSLKANENEFSGAVLVAKNGEVIFSRGFGLANREHLVPNSPDTIFRLASVSKQFTAMCIFLLQHDGKVVVDEPVSKYIDACPEAWGDVTIQNLLNHTSGIPCFTEFDDSLTFERLPSTVEATIERFRRLPLEFKPGSRMHYSNSGYVLLGQVIEKTSGQSYEDFLRKRIFQPLGMSRSGYDRPARILQGRAAGYSKNGEEIVNCIPFAMDTPHAAGALYSTVGDLLRWDEALYKETLLPRHALSQMFEPFEGEYDLAAEKYYCCGWFKRSQGGKDYFLHQGGISGFSTAVVRCPADHLYVAVLSNFQWVDVMAHAQKLVDIESNSANAAGDHP